MKRHLRLVQPSEYNIRERGFTLVELLAVLIIVAILAAVSAPIYMNYVKGARAADAQTTISSIHTSLKVYYQKTGRWVSLEELKEKREIEIDPATETKWSFQVGASQAGVTDIQAVSTEEMPGGAGKIVRYDPRTGKFTGYGIDE
jgi:prepilin-type N-terminal cleavage/methylation domain-containing protein